jgi:nicotinamide riboside transporter PnuC
MEKIPLFLAIATGAFIGCFSIAFATVFLQELFIQSILLGTKAVMVIIVITLIGWFYWKGYRKRSHP